MVGLQSVTTDRADTDVTHNLLVYLGRAFGAPALAYAEPPARITGGFDTMIYGFRLRGAPADAAMPLVLRLFRHDVGATPAQFEGTVLRTAAGLGFPVPRVLYVESDPAPLGSAFIVMARVPGRPMVDAFFSPALLRLPVLLAAMHVQLHRLETAAFRDALDHAGYAAHRLSVDAEVERAAATIKRCALDGLRPGLDWLSDRRPSDNNDPVVCHGDFHPLNILMDGAQITGVIDWSLAHVRIAARGYDVGATIALMSQGPIHVPLVLRPVASMARKVVVRRYLRAYTALQPLDANALRYYEALRCFGFLVEAGEHLQAAAGVVAPLSKPTAFAAPDTIRQISTRFRQLTGIAVSVPRVS